MFDDHSLGSPISRKSLLLGGGASLLALMACGQPPSLLPLPQAAPGTPSLYDLMRKTGIWLIEERSGKYTVLPEKQAELAKAGMLPGMRAPDCSIIPQFMSHGTLPHPTDCDTAPPPPSELKVIASVTTGAFGTGTFNGFDNGGWFSLNGDYGGGPFGNRCPGPIYTGPHPVRAAFLRQWKPYPALLVPLGWPSELLPMLLLDMVLTWSWQQAILGAV